MRVFIIVAALALAACNPAEQTARTQLPEEPREALSGACATSAATIWSGLSISAETGGDDCAAATARITISNAGDMLLTEDYPSNQVMTLAGAESVDDMQRRLGEWIIPAGAMQDSAGDLPEWVAGDDNPISAEFPFLVEEGIDRAAYEAIRTGDAPLYCYVQGMESLACFVLENSALTKVGVQTFPG